MNEFEDTVEDEPSFKLPYPAPTAARPTVKPAYGLPDELIELVEHIGQWKDRMDRDARRALLMHGSFFGGCILCSASAGILAFLAQPWPGLIVGFVGAVFASCDLWLNPRRARIAAIRVSNRLSGLALAVNQEWGNRSKRRSPKTVAREISEGVQEYLNKLEKDAENSNFLTDF